MPCKEQGNGTCQRKPECSLPSWLGVMGPTPCLANETPLNSCRAGAHMQRLAGGVEEGMAAGTREGPQDTNLPPPSDLCKTISI